MPSATWSDTIVDLGGYSGNRMGCLWFTATASSRRLSLVDSTKQSDPTSQCDLCVWVLPSLTRARIL
eukprot:12911757-Prorocentrum_lima.AAC.1